MFYECEKCVNMSTIYEQIFVTRTRNVWKDQPFINRNVLRVWEKDQANMNWNRSMINFGQHMCTSRRRDFLRIWCLLMMTMMKVTLGPKDDILRTHSTVNMAVKIKLRSARTSENSRGAPWNCKQSICVRIYNCKPNICLMPLKKQTRYKCLVLIYIYWIVTYNDHK